MNALTLLEPFKYSYEAARNYSLRKFRRDIVAGLTVSVVEVPQAMAYAIIAGVPPVYGLYTSIIQGIVGALLSSSEHMTTGPTNTQSLLIASAVGGVMLTLRDIPEDQRAAIYLQLVFGLTLIKGLIQLGFAAARLGDLVRYVSRSVIVGLIAGAGILIFIGQLPEFLGVDVRDTTSAFWGVIGQLHIVWQALHTFNPYALFVGVGVMLIILLFKMISPLAPGALVAVIVAATITAIAGWSNEIIPLIAPLPDGLPHPINPWPGLANARALLGGALALAILGMMESVAIAKSIAAKTGERISANQEFFAQGFKNALTSFFQCIPGSGSFTRSALDYAAGAETRFAAVFNGVFVALIFLLLADWARFIPRAALAGVLFVIAYGLIDWRHIRRLIRTSRSDAFVCLSTLLATLLAPLEYAIFIGVFLNIAVYLRTASQLQLQEVVQGLGGSRPFIERPIRDHKGRQKVVFLQAEGTLFFAVADELHDRLNSLLHTGTEVVILRLKRTHSLDPTILNVIEQFHHDLRQGNGYLLLCGVRPETYSLLQRYGLVDEIGRENIFPASTGVFTSAKAALRRAQELVGSSIDEVELPEQKQADANS